MIVVATKFSHKIGYGHIFRCLNIIEKFGKNNCLLIVNQKDKILEYLDRVNFKVIDYRKKNWEDKILNKYQIKIWINDRLKTTKKHFNKLNKNSIFSVSIDDEGSSHKFYDLNISQNININNNNNNNTKIINDKSLLILKKVKKNNIFIRKKLRNIMITFGGSDTYSMTNKVLKTLSETKFNINIYYGPGYKNKIKRFNNKNFKYITNIKNLENEMVKFDLLICGGGVTPLNAASQGLPSLIIACENHEIKTAQYLKKLRISNYLGFRKISINETYLNKLNLNLMSKNCLKFFSNSGSINFVNFIKKKYYAQTRS